MIEDDTTMKNVAVLVLDSVRADHCSTYGYERSTTPNLTKLAEDGYMFERMYSTGSWTVPAHGSLFTGRLPTEHGAHSNHKYFSKKPEETLAGKLSAHGYVNTCITGNPWLTSEFGFDTGFDTVEHVQSSLPFQNAGDPRHLNWNGDKLAKVSQATEWTFSGNPIKRMINAVSLRLSNWSFPTADRLNEVIFDWLENYTSEKPFFLFANYMDAHEPYLLDEPYDRYIKETTGEELSIEWNLNSLKNPPQAGHGKIVDAYDSSLHYLDKKVGSFVDKLERENVLDDTIIFILGDHGQCLGEHQYWGHGTFLYHELLHVPMVIYPPGGTSNPTNIDEAVSLTDVFGYILDIVNGDWSPDKLNESYKTSKFISAESKGKHQEIDINDRLYSKEGYRMVYYDNIFGIHNLETDSYDLTSTNNSKINMGMHKKKMRELESDMIEQLNEYDEENSEKEMSEQIRQQLEDLGYM